LTGPVRRSLRWSTIALFALTMFVAVLVLTQGRFPEARENVRVDRLERLGYELIASSGAVPLSDNSVVFGGPGVPLAQGEWLLDSYEIDRYLAAAPTCDIQLYVAGANARGLAADASVDVTLDGVPAHRISFAPATIDYVAAKNDLTPRGNPAEIYLSPINRQFGISFDTGSRFCHTVKDWRLKLTLHDVSWKIDSVGAIVRFTPPRPSRAAAALAIVAAAIVVAAMILAFHYLLTFVHFRYGFGAMIAVLGVACIALITHDEWDFAVWLRFVDLVGFGGGDPANMWPGSPRWPFIPAALFSPLLVAFYALTGNASNEIPSLFLKLLMALALAANAFGVSRVAPRSQQRFVFIVTLLAPVALYEVAGGYREIFAASFALAGVAIALRSRYLLAALLVALGTSISESLAPLLLFPMTIALLDWRRGRRHVAHAVASGATAVGVLAIEWLALIPHTFAANAVVTRVQAYRYGGASIFAVLDHYGWLPTAVAKLSLPLVAALFAGLAAPVVALLITIIVRSRGRTDESCAATLRCFLALIVALFLAYRGIDPNDWYPLFAVVALYFARFEAGNPYPIVFGAVAGMAYYTIVGIGDFVNWSYFMPSESGLLGTLGTATFVMISEVNLILIALYVSGFTGTRHLFSRGTPFYAALFVAAAATSSSNDFVIDSVFCIAAVAATGAAFYRNFDAFASKLVSTYDSRLRFVGCSAAVLCATFSANAAGIGGAPAALMTFATIFFIVRDGIGICDIAIVLGGIWILGEQNRFGWISIAGWTALSILTLVAISRALSKRDAVTIRP